MQYSTDTESLFSFAWHGEGCQERSNRRLEEDTCSAWYFQKARFIDTCACGCLQECHSFGNKRSENKHSICIWWNQKSVTL